MTQGDLYDSIEVGHAVGPPHRATGRGADLGGPAVLSDHHRRGNRAGLRDLADGTWHARNADLLPRAASDQGARLVVAG